MELSEIGMGCYALSGAYGSLEQEHFKKVLQRAHALGINYFDTAETYGEGGERLLGEVIRPFREEVHVSTKVGLTEGLEPNLSYDHLVNTCEKSLERLQTNYIDFYLVHFADPKTPIDETIQALEDLKEEGKILHYGLSHLSAENFKSYLEKGNVAIALMELNTAVRDARKNLLPLCRVHNVGGIAFSVTGRGLLTGNYTKKPDFEPGDLRNVDPLFHRARFQSTLRIVEKLREIGEKHEKSPVQVAIQWVLSQDGIICALTGTTSIEHLTENVGGSGWSLTQDDQQQLEALLKKEDDWLSEQEPVIVKEILTSELAEKPADIFSDLVYALEAALTRNMASEEEIMPLFKKLWQLRKTKGEARKTLETLQEELREVILAD